MHVSLLVLGLLVCLLVCLHAVPSNMHYNSPYVVPGRTFGQGGCHTANSSAREGAYMSTPTPVESAPVHFPQVRVSNKEGVCVQLLVEDGEGASLSRVASRSSAAFVTMAGTVVRTEMDPVPRVTPVLETQQICQRFAAFGHGKGACQARTLSLLRTR